MLLLRFVVDRVEWRSAFSASSSMSYTTFRADRDEEARNEGEGRYCCCCRTLPVLRLVRWLRRLPTPEAPATLERLTPVPILPLRSVRTDFDTDLARLFDDFRLVPVIVGKMAFAGTFGVDDDITTSMFVTTTSFFFFFCMLSGEEEAVGRRSFRRDVDVLDERCDTAVVADDTAIFFFALIRFIVSLTTDLPPGAGL